MAMRLASIWNESDHRTRVIPVSGTHEAPGPAWSVVPVSKFQVAGMQEYVKRIKPAAPCFAQGQSQDS